MSKNFSEDMYRWSEKGGSRLVFVIGDAEGSPLEWRGGGNGDSGSGGKGGRGWLWRL